MSKGSIINENLNNEDRMGMAQTKLNALADAFVRQDTEPEVLIRNGFGLAWILQDIADGLEYIPPEKESAEN